MSTASEAALPESSGPASARKQLRCWRPAWLAALLVLLALLALICSEIQREQRIARLQAAIAGIERCSLQRTPQDLFRFLPWKRIVQHCWMSFIRSGNPGFSNTLSLHGPAIDDAWLTRHSAAIRSLRGVKLKLDHCPITYQSLHALRDASNIRTLNLNYLKIGDEGLRSLGRLSRLRYLDLIGTQVTADRLEWLTTCPALATVQVEGNLITDQSVRHLAQCRALKVLTLQYTRDENLPALKGLKGPIVYQIHCSGVTDASVPALSELTSAKMVILVRPRLSAQGIAAIRAAGVDLRVQK